MMSGHPIARRWAAWLLTGAILSACASGQGAQDSKRNPQRSSITEPLGFESRRADEVDLTTLLDPENRRSHLPSETCATAEANLDHRDKDVRQLAQTQRMECALIAFKTYTVGYDRFLDTVGQDNPERRYAAAANSLALAVRRNEIQDRMLLRSDALCRDFERRLNIELTIENDTNLSNFMRNSQVRLVRSVGSLLIGGDALWALSSAARLTDLPGYVHDEGQIEKNILQLAALGLTQYRGELFRTIEGKRRAPVRHGGLSLDNDDSGIGVTPLAVYSMERAVGDALQYHNACSVNSGLKHAMKTLGEVGGESPLTRFPDLIPSAVNP